MKVEFFYRGDWWTHEQLIRKFNLTKEQIAFLPYKHPTPQK